MRRPIRIWRRFRPGRFLPILLICFFRVGLTELITELRTRYKFVVIDSLPSWPPRTPILRCSGLMMTPKEAFTRTRDLLRCVKCHMLA